MITSLKLATLKMAVVAAAALAVTSALSAKASVIADWTFETSLPATAGPFAPEVGAGSAKGNHTGAAVYSTPAGNGSAHSFSSNTWAVGDYYEFDVSTTGAPNIFFNFDQVSSSTGPGSFKLQADTGSGFNDIAGDTYTVLVNAAPNTWGAATPVTTTTFSYDLSALTGLVGIRLVDTSTTSAGNGTVATAGTDRVDNVIVSTTPILTPEPASLSLLAIGGAALLTRRRK